MKTKLFKNAAVVFTILTLAFAVSCSDDDDEMKEDTSLYTRLGGIDAISAVTDQFLANVAADSKINARFEATVANSSRLQLLRNNLIDQICAGSGGPCQYKGKTMAAAHAGMGITQDEFNALVADLVAALEKFSVPAQEKNDLLAILGPMQSDIVGK
ncbi:group I truncated hemoglobin [Ohtaekwangia koreensis]|uniref:Hemoglobin n=1 Tax=Ohtaekwangia koreensis TaxID=688867 RepID=A0A1T5MKE4_9BACT|nr:group 1 truncated hemoglobin [Ohtaekwangia koreensis]SKC88690.1 hemoglobin [Ohtaekwangia koreensis]